MSKLSLTYPTVGQKDSTEEPKVTTALQAVETFLNGQKIESTDNIKPGGIEEASLSAPVQTLLNTKSAAALSLVKKNEATFTIASGELVQMEKEASEVKLPAATLNRIVGIWCSAKTITVKAAVAGTIFGDFIEGATTITLMKTQHVLLQADGTNWDILAGEPKRTETYGALTSRSAAEYETAGLTPSTTRPTWVTLSMRILVGQTVKVTVGGVLMAEATAISEQGSTFPVFVPPGQVLKISPATTTVYTSYLTL